MNMSYFNPALENMRNHTLCVLGKRSLVWVTSKYALARTVIGAAVSAIVCDA